MRVCGMDEAGRGPWAGPVIAAAVVLDPLRPIIGLADSKTLSPARRAELAQVIRAHTDWGLGGASPAEIDQLNILQATFLAMARALQALAYPVDLALVDGNRAPALPCAVRTMIGGDATEPAIAAASILAKTARDALMIAADQEFPGYGFARHKGYGVAAHAEALTRLGPCALHRVSFKPVRRALGLKD
ncbi:MAG TPA: ribonuclease HII [Hyphomonadaceae bacterium]|nr:ribonuclease HII [Hyphomonadaceae bacterium]